MSSEKRIDAVQAQINTPSLSDLNPLQSNDPLLQTLAHGDIPSNAVLNNAIDKAKENLESSRAQADLNLRGEALARDTTQILDTAQRFINEKNKDEKIQDLIKHSKEASDAASREASTFTSSVGNMLSHTLGLDNLLRKDTYTAQRDADAAYGYVREIFLFTVQSKEFRSFLLDFINFFQSTLTNATEKVNLIGESLKSDVVRSDTNMSATSSTANAAVQQTKLDTRSTIAQWNAETKREYYKRFQTLLNRISGKPEYKRLLGLYWKWMDDLKTRALQVTETLKEKASDVADQASTSVDRLAQKSAWDKLWVDVRGVVDGFAGNGTFDSFYVQAWDFYYTLINDKEANDYLESLKSFINEAVNNPASLNTDAKIKQGEDLLDQGRNLFESKKYSTKFNNIVNTGSDVLNRISHDAISNELSSKFKQFMEDFALDAQGRPDLNVMSDSLSQLKNLVYPLLSKQLSSLTIARLVGSNDTYDWAIEHMLVSVPDLIPEHFTLKTKNLLSINVKELETEKSSTKVTMEISNLRPNFKDLKFWYLRKTFPKVEDYGTVDIDLSKGQGAKIKIIWKIKSKQNRPFAFSLMEVRCVIDSMEVTIKDAKHSVFDRVATSLFSATLKQQVAAGIVNGIVDALSPINDQMNDWFATRPATSLYEKANDSIHYYYDQTNRALKDHPIDKAMDLASELKDKAADAVNYVKDNASSAVQNIKTTAENTLVAAKEVVVERSTEAKEFINKEIPELSKAVSDIKVGAESMADKGKVEVENAWDHAWEKKAGRRNKRKNHKKTRVGDLPLENNKEFPILGK